MGLSSFGGLLPFSNSNDLVMEFGSREIIPIAREVPIIFGLCATDPTIELEQYIESIRQGYDLEVDMIRKAHELDDQRDNRRKDRAHSN
ncbi:predicted TIM-barrel enzyme [Paenibacillus popilliae ATCC 14706]|uniref:Predicted TIM-barrel enzyme n=2 Tax=Paenibacillus popilliae TaxID=78057 RepID=M9LZK3_PAEPP|nr:predicted TIM-barrel enzyme [Paenibacillus popilliae ATCC 14706]